MSYTYSMGFQKKMGVIIAANILLLMFAFQNCNFDRTQSGSFYGNKVSSQSQTEIENGIIYDGKLTGRYERNLPGHKCNGIEVPYQVIEVSESGKVLITTNKNNNCGIVQEISMADLSIPFYHEETGLVGFGNGAFVKESRVDSNSTVEAWCTEGRDASGYSAIVRREKSTGKAFAQIIIETGVTNNIPQFDFQEPLLVNYDLPSDDLAVRYKIPWANGSDGKDITGHNNSFLLKVWSHNQEFDIQAYRSAFYKYNVTTYEEEVFGHVNCRLNSDLDDLVRGLWVLSNWNDTNR